MDWLLAALLGLIQGLTEFLPISSSAHLRIVSDLFTGQDVGAAFTAIVQIGTETAVIVYFWRDIVRIVSHWARSLVGRLPKSDPDARMGWLIIVGSLPIGVLGLLFQDQIEGALRNLWIVGGTLIVFGLLLAVADATGRKERDLEHLTWGHGLLYGCFQALALIPGVSRSGGTITGGLLMGYTREAAARYSFLLAIPAVLASGLFELYKSVFKDPHAWDFMGRSQTLLATLIAFGVGYAVIAWFLKYVSTHDYRPFVYYRVALGLLLFVLLGVGALPALD